MKKRLLSFLLLLSMLLSMVPVMAQSGESTGGGAEGSQSESYTNAETYYDLYRKDGLIAFFDALTADNGTVDFTEGKWYAKVWNGEEFVVDNTKFATMTGGAYDESTNPTGWKTDIGGAGLGYDDPNFDAATNVLTFDKLLLSEHRGQFDYRYDNWTIDSLLRVKLRSIPMSTETFTVGSAEHPLVFTTTALANVYTAQSTTYWQDSTSTPFTIALSGPAGAAVEITVTSALHPNGTKVNVTFNDAGKATASVAYRHSEVKVETPTNVTVDSLIFKVVETRTAANVNDAFLFGSVAGTHTTNLLGMTVSGDGYGEIRWTATTHPGSFGSHVTYKLLADSKTPDQMWNDSTSFKVVDGQVAPLHLVKTMGQNLMLSYHLYHGGIIRTATIRDGIEDLGLHILKGDQGYAYAFRIYNVALNAEEMATHTSLDNLIRLGVSLEKFNTMHDALKETFLSTTMPSLDKNVTKQEVEAAIDAAVLFDAQTSESKKLDKYEQLYVGANGETTANGGHLVALFSAYGEDVSANVGHGAWVNKVGDNNITFGNKQYWKKEANSVGFDIYAGMVDANGNFTEDSPYNTYPYHGGYSYGQYPMAQTRLQLGLDLLPKEDFTVEFVAQYKNILTVDADGNPLGDYLTYSGQTNTPGMQQYVGAVDEIGFLVGFATNRNGKWIGSGERNNGMWLLGVNVNWGSHNGTHGTQGSSAMMGENYTAWKKLDKIYTYAITRDETLVVDGANRTVSAHYELLRDYARFASADASTANPTGGKCYYDFDDTNDFYLSSALPTDFHAVRIYDAVLTKEEMEQNRFADMAAYAGADLTQYLTLSPVNRAVVNSVIAASAFVEHADDFVQNLESLISSFDTAPTAEQSLYVQDGLRVLVASYQGFNTGVFSSDDNSISWLNAVKRGESVTLKGEGWELRGGGGYYIQRTYDEWLEETQGSKFDLFGMYLTADMLPADDYTIEMVINPVGITTEDENGNITRLVDDFTQHGAHNEYGFAIGPLRNISFPCGRGTGIGGMELRWVYDYGTRCWYGFSNRNEKFVDRTWQSTTIHDVVSYSITYDLDDYTGDGTYSYYHNAVRKGSDIIRKNNIISNERANNMFQLMVGMPGGIFATRVYTRLLTDMEKQQNHVADIIYYYGLDVGVLPLLLENFTNDKDKIYGALADLSFSMTKEEAQALFDSRLSALWISFEDVAIRNSTEDNALRYYFNFNEASAILMLLKGYTVEVGAIANLNQNTAPSLDYNNYDYRIVAYDNIAGKNDGFFVDDDTFALTVLADDADKATMLTGINVLGYVKMVSGTGEEIVLYAAPQINGREADSFFAVYNQMAKQESLAGNEDLIEHLTDTVENSYDNVYIYLDAAAAAGGDGSKGAPFNEFEEAFKAAKAKLLMINKPTYFYLRADDGIYGVSEVLTVDDADIPYEYCRFIITSRKNKSTITSTRPIDSTDFVEVDDCIYTYQFEKDANGEYPYFRYLYVNGEIATIARNSAGSINEYDEIRYQSDFQRYDDGPYLVAKRLWQTKQLTTTYNYYPKDRLMLSTRFAYYRDAFLAYDEVKALSAAGGLTLQTPSANTNMTAVYLEFFEDYRMKQVAQNELEQIFKTTYKGEVELAKESFAAVTTAIENAPKEYVTYFESIRKILSDALIEKNAFNILLADYSALSEQIMVPFLSHAYDLATAANENGTLTYTSVTPYVGENDLAQGKQFIYYRDAYLALRDIEMLAEEGNLTLASVGAAEGSAQYKALFESYKNRGFAFMELSTKAAAFKAETNGDATWKAKLAAYETAETNAAYREAFYALRREIVLSDYTLLSSFVLEVDPKGAIYEGTIPFGDPREEAKLYFDINMVGDLSRAIADGLAKLPADSAALKASATQAFDEMYAKLTKAEGDLAAQKASLLQLKAAYDAMSAGAEKTATRRQISALEKEIVAAEKALVALRADVNEAYVTYEKDMTTANRYLDGEYQDRYKIQNSGLELQMTIEWCFDIIHMAGIDYTDKIEKDGKTYVALYIKQEEYKNFAFSNTDNYYFERMATVMNSDVYLSKNNEYYYDSVNGLLYYYCDGNIDELTFAYPTMDNFLYVTDATRLTVSKLTFTGFDDAFASKNGVFGGQATSSGAHINSLGITDYFPSRAPIYVYDAQDLIVTGCTFQDIGCEGVSMRGRLENVTISDNTFKNVGAAAVRVGGIAASLPRWSNEQGSVNVVVTNNYLENIANRLYNSPAIYFQSSLDSKISYNTIRKCGYSGISVGWNWSPVSYYYSPTDNTQVGLKHFEICNNYIESFMMELGDGGAIYTLGGNANREDPNTFNWNHHNYIVFTNITGDGEAHFYAGLYHDGSSTSWETYSNVVVAQSYGAVKGEELDDDEYAEIGCPLPKEEYLRRMRWRKSAAAFFFAQYIVGAQAYSINFHDNFFIGGRETSANPAKQHSEAFRDYINEAHNVTEDNTTYVNQVWNFPTAAEDIAYSAGCDWYTGDPSLLYDNNY